MAPLPEFSPPRRLAGSHTQTLWGGLLRRVPRAPLRLERWPTPDGDLLRVHWHAGDADQPVLVLVHGLEGDVSSPYLAGAARRAMREGWGVVAMEHRSCGGEMNRARRMYHLGITDDLGLVVEETARRFAGRPLGLVGYSLGGNQVAKFLGERGAQVAVSAAAVVSAPYDTESAAPHLERALGGVYVKSFLRTLVPKALAKERQYPGCLDATAVRRCRTLTDFDRHATAVLHGFSDHVAYWRETSCRPWLAAIERPTLLLSARDDPFMAPGSLPEAEARANPHLQACWTPQGGHVGFVAGTPWRASYWCEETVMAFLTPRLRAR